MVYFHSQDFSRFEFGRPVSCLSHLLLFLISQSSFYFLQFTVVSLGHLRYWSHFWSDVVVLNYVSFVICITFLSFLVNHGLFLSFWVLLVSLTHLWTFLAFWSHSVMVLACFSLVIFSQLLQFQPFWSNLVIFSYDVDCELVLTCFSHSWPAG